MDDPIAPGITEADLTRLAHLQRLRIEADTDELGRQKDGMEHHPDVAALAGTMAVVEAQTPHAPGLLDDDRTVFVDAQLDGGVFDYD